MVKIQNSFIKIYGKAKIELQNGPISTTGKYFYSTSSTDWSSLNNWFTNSSHTIQASTLPTSATDVIVLGNVAPIVDLDAVYWVQPNSINSGTAGIVFNSVSYGNVSCNIVGNATFNGNSTYNI
jgi:hypothetical protein